MDQLKESGTLPVGVEVDGVLHSTFVLRPRLVRDSVNVLADEKAQSNDAYRGVALISMQLESLGTLEKDKITPDLLLDMLDIDMAEIMKANDALGERLTNFRKDGAGAAQVASGAAQGGDSVASGG